MPAPSVLRTYPLVPPVILRFDTAPNETLAVVVKFTTPVALLTVRPVNDPSDVIFGCAAVVSVPCKKLAIARFPKLALAALKFPVILAVPVMLAPVPVITSVALLVAVSVMFAFAVITTVLLPFTRLPVK